MVQGLPMDSQDPFRGHEVETIFIMISRYYLPFLLSSFHKCAVEFSEVT